MNSTWKEKRFYPLLGVLLLISLLYLNFTNNFSFNFLQWQHQLPHMAFVSTNSTHFIIIDEDRVSGDLEEENVTPFYVNGWNSYWLMQESVWSSKRSKVSKIFKIGAQLGLTVCRTWAFSDGGYGSGVLQLAPGLFNERVFRGLDYVIDEARRNRVRLILSLVNNLNAFGGKAQYVRWAEEAGINVSSTDDSFFSNPVIKEYYKAYAKAIVTRKNTITGLKYSVEPAIFAWELMNEPRCVSSASAPALQVWIAEMAAFIKSLDTKHLVTVGLEGFYGPNTTKSKDVNPGDWAASLGTDFIQNSAINNIDFASVHAYPDSWIPHDNLKTKANFLSNWVDSHIVAADALLKKPVLFTEVGSTWHVNKNGVYDRDALLKTMYNKIVESAKRKQAGAGALIWQLVVEGVEEYADQFSLIPGDYPSTYKLIKEQSCRLENISSSNRKESTMHDKDSCFGHL